MLYLEPPKKSKQITKEIRDLKLDIESKNDQIEMYKNSVKNLNTQLDNLKDGMNVYNLNFI